MNADVWQIFRHTAAEPDSRLPLLRRRPATILLHGADGDASRSLLAARYPEAAFIGEYDPRRDFLDAAARARAPKGWRALFTPKSGIPQTCLPLGGRLPENAAEMLWSNLLVPQAEDLHALLANWSQALQDNGLLFFTGFGADSLPELREVLRQNGIACAAPALADMHDLADMLLEHDFYDPVADTAKLVLSYKDEAAWRRDTEMLGLWQALRPEDAAAARQAAHKAWLAGSLRETTLEIVQAHAIRKLLLPENTNIVRFYPRNRPQ